MQNCHQNTNKLVNRVTGKHFRKEAVQKANKDIKS